jgi:uncharacterized protein (TIGR02594 family)
MANPLLDKAASMLGMNERTQRAALMDYLKTGGVNLDPATQAWCAAFVNSTLKQSGMEGTGSNLARSFLNYGEAVDKPQEGDIVVFSRGDPKGPYGHVGFYKGMSPDGKYINVLGGNQGDAVSVKQYPADRLLGYRRPAAAMETASTPAPAPGILDQLAAVPPYASVPPSITAALKAEPAPSAVNMGSANGVGIVPTMAEGTQPSSAVGILGSLFKDTLMRRKPRYLPNASNAYMAQGLEGSGWPSRRSWLE